MSLCWQETYTPGSDSEKAAFLERHPGSVHAAEVLPAPPLTSSGTIMMVEHPFAEEVASALLSLVPRKSPALEGTPFPIAISLQSYSEKSIRPGSCTESFLNRIVFRL